MKKRYSRKQIQEALHWWRAQLKRLDESKEFDDFDTQVQSDELSRDEEDGSEPDYSEYEAAVKRYHQKDKENLEAERKYLGLGPDEVVCLIMGGLCIYNGKTHESRGLTKEQYDKYCELSKKWRTDWEENVGKYWPKKKSKKKVSESAEHEYEVVATALGRCSATIDQTVNARDLYELAEFVREDFARELGVDAEDVRFTFDKVVDENGKDLTQQANEKRLNESLGKESTMKKKKQHTREEIMEAISHWKGVLKRMNESEDKDRTAELDAFAQTICGFITKAVMNGFWKPEYEGEQPTRDRIEASIPWAMLPGVTAEEKAYVMDKVYPKLRKNSVFSKMKKAMRGEED